MPVELSWIVSLYVTGFIHKGFLFIEDRIGLGTNNSIGVQAEKTGFTFRFLFCGISCLLELFKIFFSDALYSLFQQYII